MGVLYTVLCAVVVIGFLVIIHEGGHYLASRAFGVRVTEFMVGLPGPSVGFTAAGTRFGITAIPLGGYAKVCGMDTDEVHPALERAMAYIYSKGTVTADELKCECRLGDDDAEKVIDQLLEWGTIVSRGKGEEAVFCTPAYKPARKARRFSRRHSLPAQKDLACGSPRHVPSPRRLFNREFSKQYRSLPFWKRSVILLAGIAVNLAFAMIAFIVIYSVIGIDVVTSSGEARHITVTPIQSIQAGFAYIGMVFQAIIGLFNPQTASETISQSSSIVGIAVMSADYFSQGVAEALFFMAAISVSLGLMNLIPIPPLDGGRFLIEIVQRLTGKEISMRAMGYISMAGMALFLCFFVFMLNQDIQRFVFGNW